jgi:MtN3 and saliva related transmembrane protein
VQENVGTAHSAGEPARSLRIGPARVRTHVRLEVAISPAYIGYAAGALTVASYIPQVVRVWKTKETKDLSWGMFGLLVTASVLWIIYGASSSQWPVIATNAGCGLLNVAILVAKIRFR